MQNNKRIIKVKINKFEIVLSIICIISNFSQIPFLLNNNITKFLVMISWFILLYCIIVFKNNLINLNQLNIIYLIFIFDFFILLNQFFKTENYINSNFIYPVHLSLFVFIVSYLTGQLIKEASLNKILNSYIYSSLIVSLYIFFDKFLGANWINSIGYLYSSKNSIATILVIAVLCTIFYFNNTNKMLKISIIIFFSIMILMLKSRANIVALIIISIYEIFFGVKNKRKKFFYILIFLSLLLIIFTNNFSYDFFINNILLNNREGFNLNDISSGRVDHLMYFENNFKKNILLGNGCVYLESFPLAILMSYGIAGSFPIFIFSIYPLIIVYLYRKDYINYKIRNFIILLNLVLLINGFFEELSPFGPGVKCYLLWMVSGIYLGMKAKEKIYSKRKKRFIEEQCYVK